MADFIKTITNSVRAFGGSPTSKWGQVSPYTFTWGTTKWGEGTFTVIFSYDKLISNALLPDTALSKQTDKFITAEIIASGDMSSEISSNGIWRIVFVSDTINVEDRDTASYTSGSLATSSFTCFPAGSTNWS